MRLIGQFPEEKQAYAFYTFLQKQGIESTYDSALNTETKVKEYRIWIVDEDACEVAMEWLVKYRQNPESSDFQDLKPPFVPYSRPKTAEEPAKPDPFKIRISVRPKALRMATLTMSNLLLLLCAFLFLWNTLEEEKLYKERGALALELGMTQLQETLLFDYPYAYQRLEKLLDEHSLKSFEDLKELPPDVQAQFHEADAIPAWKGIYDIALHRAWAEIPQIPLFEKIRQGQVWRLFTPCLLHRDFLHILFNMAWLWILGRQIEERIGKGRFLLMALIIGIFSNLAQYLMSGPYFLGFSGVVVGMAGFIWVRQRNAPWEGYPLNRLTLLFLFFFVLAMFALEIIAFALKMTGVSEVVPNIANTAHLLGGFIGMLLAKIPYFSRRPT